MIGIFLADDHTIVRDGLRMLIEAQADMLVVGEAGDGSRALQQIVTIQPDVAVLDISMPELGGLEVCRQIRARTPNTQVVILSMHGTSSYVVEALTAGAKGYLVKTSAGRRVVDAIRTVHRGQRYLDPEILDAVVEFSLQHKSGQTGELEDRLALLSDREKQILAMLADGQTNIEIASTLKISIKTVESHRSSIMKKLELENIPDLVKFAIRHGLIDID